MPDSPSDKPKPADALQPTPTGEDTLEVLSDDDMYAVAEPQPVQPGRAPAPQPVAVQAPPPVTARPRATSSLEMGKIVAPLDEFLGRPVVFRVIGYISGVLALVTLLVSLVAWFWGRNWFDRALLFAVIFFVCIGTAAVLEAIQKAKGKPTPKE